MPVEIQRQRHNLILKPGGIADPKVSFAFPQCSLPFACNANQERSQD
jgi:hypothetical protein